MASFTAINRAVKGYDSLLYAERERNGRVHIFRASATKSRPPNFIFALTENWTANGKPVEWGIEVILNRLRAIDIWNGRDVVAEIEAEDEKIEASKKRDFRNNVESFLSDFRRQFAKATNEINTSTLEKIDPRRKGDKKHVG